MHFQRRPLFNLTPNDSNLRVLCYPAEPDWFFCFQQDCEDSLQSSEPEIRFALDYGEQLVDDDLTDSDEKQKIQEDVIDIERTLKDLKEEAHKEKIRYGAYLGYMYNCQS